MQQKDLEEFSDAQFQVTQQLYDAVLAHYERIEAEMGSTFAIGVIISSLATTMGTVLAQLPASHRDSYFAISKELLDASFSEAIGKLAIQQWSQIGHA